MSVELREEPSHAEDQHAKDDAPDGNEFHLVKNTVKQRLILAAGRSASSQFAGQASPGAIRFCASRASWRAPQSAARRSGPRQDARSASRGSRSVRASLPQSRSFALRPSSSLIGAAVGFFEHRRRLIVDAPPYAGQREAVGEDQLLDAQHALDVGAPVDARPASRLCDTPRSGNSDSHDRSTYGCTLAISHTSDALKRARLGISTSATNSPVCCKLRRYSTG